MLAVGQEAGVGVDIDYEVVKLRAWVGQCAGYVDRQRFVGGGKNVLEEGSPGN